MRRVIVDYKRLDHEIAAKLIDLYPHGYGDDDIIVLKKPNGELVEAVEVKTNDTIYLVKISKSLSNFISSFDDTIEKELENSTPELEETSGVSNLNGDTDSNLGQDSEDLV